MEKYLQPEIRVMEIDTAELMDNPVSENDQEGDGDQLSNDGLDNKLDGNAPATSVWDQGDK